MPDLIAYVVPHVPDSIVVTVAVALAGCAFVGILRIIDGKVGGGPASWEDASIAAVDGHPAGHPASNPRRVWIEGLPFCPGCRRAVDRGWAHAEGCRYTVYDWERAS